MKKTIRPILIILLVVAFWIFCVGCANNTKSTNTILRLHIRANSNVQADQEVKLKVRDKITIFLEDELGDCVDLAQAIEKLQTLTAKIESIANGVLTQNGFDYTAKAKVNNEFFPTRMYENLVVESGYYDALIINLGTGEGDNWWCVIYPPLCYVEAELGDGFKYKSKIKELIEKYFG